MRLVLLISSLLILTGVCSGQILINNVFDGPLSGGTPKGVELFVYQDVPDLSVYGIGSANNGGGTDGEEFTFPNTAVTAGTFLYVASEATNFANFFGFAPDFVSSAANINGDDAIELFMNGTVVDLYGDVNTRGDGEVWEYEDGWAYGGRRSAPSATFNPADWDYSGANALDNETTNATAASPIPIGRSLLPVTLTTLSAHPMPKSVMVKWATATEDGSDFFAVERSSDGGRTFTEIGRVTAAGNSRAELQYELEDRTPTKGQVAYRLRSVDLDGSYAYSEQVMVRYDGAAALSAFPNPTTGELRLTGLPSGRTQVSVVTTDGQSRTVPVVGGRIDVSDLPPGLYFLRGAADERPVRFVKQ